MLRRPFVLLGSQTNKRSFLEAQSTGSNKAVSLIDTNGPNNNPTHMVKENIHLKETLIY